MARVIVATAHHHILQHLAAALHNHGHNVVGLLSAGALPVMDDVVAQIGCPHVRLPLINGELNLRRAMRNDPKYAETLRAAVEPLQSLNAEFMVGWAIHVLPPFMLQLATHPINVHPSDLPRYRGGFPFEAQILNGERKFSVTVHHTVPKIDAGGVLARSQPLKIRRTDTMLGLLNRSLPIGAELAAQVVTHWGHLPEVPPPPLEEPIPHAWGIKRFTDRSGVRRNAGVLGRLRIEWSIDKAVDIGRAARAFDMIGGALTNRGPDLFRITASTVARRDTTEAPGTVLAADEDLIEVQAVDAVVRLKGRFMESGPTLAVGDRLESTEPISRVLTFPNAER